MSDKEMKALVNKLSKVSAKKVKPVIEAGQLSKFQKVEAMVKKEMTRQEFKEFSDKCEDRQPWPEGTINKCRRTDWACRDCICPKLKK